MIQKIQAYFLADHFGQSPAMSRKIRINSFHLLYFITTHPVKDPRAPSFKNLPLKMSLVASANAASIKTLVNAIPTATSTILDIPSRTLTPTTLFTMATAVASLPSNITSAAGFDWHKDGFYYWGNTFEPLFLWILSWIILLVFLFFAVVVLLIILVICYFLGSFVVLSLWFGWEEQTSYTPLTETESRGPSNNASIAIEVRETVGGSRPRASAYRSPTVEDEVATTTEKVLEEESPGLHKPDECSAIAKNRVEVAATEKDKSSLSEADGSSDGSADNDDDAVWQADPLYQEARNAH